MPPSNILAPQSATKIEPGDLLTEHEAAAILSTAVRTLRNWRALHKGPRYRKIGARMVRYHIADLANYQKIMAGDAEATA
ncbi:MAG: helix-turn-helix domain-containing protein [Rhodanobacter sp.]